MFSRLPGSVPVTPAPTTKNLGAEAGVVGNLYGAYPKLTTQEILTMQEDKARREAAVNE